MNNLAFLAYSHAGGWGDWLAHVTISAVVHALINGFVFRLMHLTLGQVAVLVIVVLGFLFLWARAPRPARHGRVPAEQSPAAAPG